MKRVVFWAAYAAALALLIVAIDVVLHMRYVSALESRDRPATVQLPVVPNASDALAKRVGFVYFRSDKLSSYPTFPTAKPKGVVRIGAFGDSFTHGDEVDRSSDFPTQLANLMRARGIAGVEVLNFGVDGFGFDETYLMWSDMAALYEIDYVLLGPGTFYSDRTTRFNSWRIFPYFLHSRFVLAGDELVLIDVLGDTYPERFSRYYRFLTPWRYLRYDRNDPPFLAAALPDGQSIGNPFYYSGLPEKAEAIAIQRRLLMRMKRPGKPVIVGLNPEFDDLRKALADLADERLCAMRVDRSFDFPYLASRGHNSATANTWVARQYLAMLLGESVEAPVLHTADLGAPPEAANLPSADPASYDQVQIMINGIDVGRFTDAAGKMQAPSFLRDRGIRTVLALKADDRSLLDAVFLALPAAVDPSLPVRLVHRTWKGTKNVVIPSRKPFGGALNLRVIDLPAIQRWWRDPIVISAASLSALFGAPLAGGTLAVMLGDSVILEGVTPGDSSDTRLQPTDGEIYLLRSAPTGDVAPEQGPRSGLAELVLQNAGQAYSLPIARWWIERRRVDPTAACPAGWVAPLGGTRSATGG
jgi:hypothetical protein